MKTKINFLILLLVINTSILYSQTTPKFQWVKGGGSQGSATNSGLMESCKWMGTDSRGNIYGMSSVFYNNIQIDTSIRPIGFGNDDFAVFSYRCDGSMRWVRYFGNDANDVPIGMFTDNEGNNFITGQVVAASLYLDTHFGDSIIPYGTTNIPAVFVAKLDSNGHTTWLTFGPLATSVSNVYNYLSVQPDNQGNVCVLTQFNGAITWDSFTIPEQGYYVLKFDKNNGYLLGVTKLDFNANSNFSSKKLNYSIDKSNSIYLNYTFSDTINIGGTVYPPSLYYKYFIAKFSSNGSNLWSRVFGEDIVPPDYMQIRNGNILCVNNNIYISGIAQNGSVFLGDSIHNLYPGQYSQFPVLLKLNGITGNLISKNIIYSTLFTILR